MRASFRIALFAILVSAATTRAVADEAAPAGKAPVAAAKAPPAPPQPIAQEQVFRAAEDLAATLRKAESAGKIDSAVEDVQQRLGTVQAERHLWADLTPAQLDASTLREMERLRQTVQRDDQVLAEGQAVLEERTAVLADVIDELGRLTSSWQLTGEAVRKEKAPPAVLNQVQAALDQLHAAEKALRVQQNRLLELQGKLSALGAEITEAGTRLEAAETSMEKRMFEARSVPLWRAITDPRQGGSLGGQFREAMQEARQDVATFLAEAQLTLLIHLGVIVAFGLALLSLRKPVAAMEAGDETIHGAVQVLARPWSAAILLSVALVGWIHPPLPPAVKDVALVGILIPMLLLLPGLVPELFRRPLYGVAALFALDKVLALAPPQTVLARLALLLVTFATLAGLGRGVLRGGWARSLPGGVWGTMARVGIATALGLLVASVGFNLTGNVTLAELLTHGTLTSATLAALLFGMQTVLEATLATFTRLPALQRLRIIANHRALLRQRSRSSIRLASVVFWAWRTSIAFGIDDALKAAADAFLAFRLHVGGLDVTLGNLVAFGVTLTLAVLLSRAVRFTLDEGIFPELDLPRGIPATLSKIAQYIVLVLGFSWAMLASGIEMTRFSFLVGALGVGVGFGLQNVVNNFVSGVILLLERPIQMGDQIEVGGVAGEVTRIGVRSSTVKTGAGAEVIVPNATLISAEVTNWTGTDMKRRVDVQVGVAYDAPPQQVIELMLAAVHGRPGVLVSPAPGALLTKFGESSIAFELQFWTAAPGTAGSLASQAMIEILASFARAGIRIPNPQRDLHIRTSEGAERQELAKEGAQEAKV